MEVILIGWIVMGVAAALVAISAAADLTLTTVDRSHLRKLAAENSRKAAALIELLDKGDRLWLSILLARTLALLAAGLAFGALWRNVLDPWAVTISAFLAWFMLVAAHVIGRALVLPHIEQAALRLTPWTYGLTLLFSPLTYLLTQLGAQLGRGNAEEPAANIFLSEDGLRRLLNAQDGAAALEENERELIVNILEMDDTVAREVMVPRIDMVTLPVDSSVQHALEKIIAAGHSRIPVYDGDADVIVGLLYAKDLLQCMRDHRSEVDIRTLLRPAYFVPASKKVDDLLREMQQQRIHLAMVVDEYGGIAGLVTIENIIEEIFGEIRDEFDVNEALLYQVMNEESFLFDSRLDLDTLGKLLGTDLSEEETDTLGGLIYSYLGRVPMQGEATEVEGWRFTVLSLNGRRIGQVRADRLPPADAAGVEPSQPAAQPLLPSGTATGSLRTADV